MDLEYEQALERILAALPPPVAEPVPLTQAHQRFLATTVLAETDLPPFDNSAVDGYAVRSPDVAGASAGAPVSLRVLARVAAGQRWDGTVSSGGCVRLFTGSPLPAGADAVVMQEDTTTDPRNPGVVSCAAPVAPGDFIRRRGEDVARGTTLAEPGDELTPGRISLLAANGIATVQAGRRPTVAILATGSELREPGHRLMPGEIYESTRAALAALVASAGGVPHVLPVVPDDLEASGRALQAAFEQADVVVSSGGVSVGELDFVRRALNDIGGKLDFWRVAMRPGRPFAFGRVGARLFFGLPGNPVSALVTFFLLARPALLRLQGAHRVLPACTQGVLAEDLNNPGDRRHFVRVRVDASGKVHSAGLQGSHAISSLAAANGLADVPPRSKLEAGSAVKVFVWA